MNKITMSKFDVSRSGLVVDLDRSKLLCFGFDLISNNLDPCKEALFLDLFRHVRDRYTFISLELNSSSISIYCGKMLSEFDNFHQIAIRTRDEISNILSSKFRVVLMSGYQFPINRLVKSKSFKNHSHDGSNYFQYYGLSNLEVTNFHPKMLRILLEIPSLVLYLSFNKFSDSTFCLMISISANNLSTLFNIKQSLISNLKHTPYFSGLLVDIKPKTISKHPGIISFGISDNQIEKEEFSSFLQLIPTTIREVTIIEPPEVNHRINVSDCKEKSILDSSMANDIDKAKSISKIRDLDSILKLLNKTQRIELKQLKENLEKNDWDISSIVYDPSSNNTNITLTNEGIILSLSVNLRDLTYSTEFVDEYDYQMIFSQLP